MAQSNVLNCTYSGKKLLNSYPPLKLQEVGAHVTLCIHRDKARLLDCKTKKKKTKKNGQLE